MIGYRTKNNIPEFIQGFSYFVSKTFFWLKCSTETKLILTKRIIRALVQKENDKLLKRLE